MAGESTNWYKVEVNEKTQETKYILKKDSMWAKVGWDYWLYSMTIIYLDMNLLMLYDKPNGKVIEKTRHVVYHKARVFKVKGDWVYVKSSIPTANESIYGWVRWRKDRKILVGSIFNNFDGRWKKTY